MQQQPYFLGAMGSWLPQEMQHADVIPPARAPQDLDKQGACPQPLSQPPQGIRLAASSVTALASQAWRAPAQTKVGEGLGMGGRVASGVLIGEAAVCDQLASRAGAERGVDLLAIIIPRGPAVLQ